MAESAIQVDENIEKKLDFSEVLFLLSRKLVPGRGVPNKYDHPPWRLPSNHQNAGVINTMLEYSMKIQSGHIPKSDEFSEFILSNSSLAVAGLLQYYLSLLQIKSEIVFGILEWDEQARSGPEDFEGTPHIWLSLEGVPIDNAHVAFPPSADNVEYFFECKKMNSYLPQNPVTSKMRLFLGQEEDLESREVLRHNLRVLQTYSESAHVGKYLAVSLANPELNPGFKLYHILMGDFMKNNFSVDTSSLQTKQSVECWWCRKVSTDPEALKTCTVCKVAKYCGRDCQRQEWKVHKLLHQELDHTRRLLKDNEDEEREREQSEAEEKEKVLQSLGKKP